MGAPVPSKGNNASERLALLTMAYFHPWTLRAEEEEYGVVPYAGSLRAGDESLETALKNWFDGHISQESSRYVCISLSVPRPPSRSKRRCTFG